MISKALEITKSQSALAGERLAKVRAQIQDSFAKDYVVGSSTLEALLKAQKSVHYWAQVDRVIESKENDEARIEALREWYSRGVERVLECGRSHSTSLVTSAEMEAEEDEYKRVLAMIKQLLSYADKQ